MFNFLHTFQPQATITTIGPLDLRWYGLFLAAGVLAGLLLSLWLAKKDRTDTNLILDLSVWLIVSGLLGARLYEVILEWSYYKTNLGQIISIWQGGLAIHGAIIGGAIALFVFSSFKKLNFWRLTAICLPGLALGQAIGRWGNYFNQELFGRPTNLPWGIPIHPLYRPLEYLADSHFHPTFLYESLGCLIIALALFGLYNYGYKKWADKIYIWLIALYMLLYSWLRFGLEFIRVDETILIWGLRWPQIFSLILVIAAFLLIIRINHHVPSKSSPS